MTTGGVMVGLAGIQDNLFRPLRSDLIRIGPHKKDWGQRCLVRLSILPNFIRRTTADQPVDRSLYQSMRWRMIGPFRAGRTVGAVGIPSQPNVFYIGVNNGGVWKTTDAGRTWQPIFDDQPTGSIGDIAVAPSNPNIIYVGSGEGLQRPDLSTGDGMYKSIDGGQSWQHLGARSHYLPGRTDRTH